MAQGGNPRPDELWTFEADGGADVNDVAIDADGKVVTAVQGDASAVRTDDDEVYAWDLTRSTSSSTPDMRDDPSANFGDAEGLGVVAIEPNPGGKGDFIAVGDEGSGDAGQNNVHVYRRSTGGGSENAVSYEDDANQPSGAVVDMWFLDRSTLLVYHEDALSVLEHQTGTNFEGSDAGIWTPDGDETIRDVSVSQAQDRVAVLTSSGGDNTGDDTLSLRLLEDRSGQLTSIAEPWTRSGVAPEGQVELSRNGQFAVVATGANTLYYMGVEDYTPPEGEDPDDPPEQKFSDLPWSRNGPADVSAVAIAPKGDWLAAGFANGELVVYQRTQVTDEGPRAERAHDATVDTGVAAERMSFADGNRSLLVQGAGLMAFHERQFTSDEDIQALWTLPGVSSFDVSRDGQRIAVAGTQDGNGVVQTFEQSYEASLDVDTPTNVQPGRTFNVTATVQNQGSTLDAYRIAISGLGGGWNVENPDDALRLLPGETGNTTVTLTPSRTQAPGEANFTVRAVSQMSPDQRDVASEDTSVQVQELHAAELDVDTSERSVSQGETIELDAEITNAGNTREPIQLRVGQDADWTVRIDGEETPRASFRLDPGGSTTASVEIVAPSDAPKGTRNTVEIAAQPEDGGTEDRASVPVVVDPSYDAAFEVPSEPVDVQAGETVNTEITVLNAGNTRDTYTLEVGSEASNPEHLWRAELSTNKLTLEDEGEETVTVTVDVPRGAVEGDSATVTLTATSSATGDEVGEESYDLQIPEETEDSPTSALAALAAIGLAAFAIRRRDR